MVEIKGRHCVDYGTDHVFYDCGANLIEEYEKEDLPKIPFNNPNFIMMVYTSEDRVKKVLQQNNFLKGIYVDNDHGLIVPIEEFIHLGMPVQ